VPPDGSSTWISYISNPSSKTNCSYDCNTLSISDKNRSAFSCDSRINGKDMGKSSSGHCTDMRTRSDEFIYSVMFLMMELKSILKLFKMFGIPLISRALKVI